MKKIILTAAAAVLISVGSFAQTVDKIVKQNIAAMGGMEKLKSLKTVKIESNVSVQGIEVPSTVVIIDNVGTRSDFKVQGMTGTQVVTKTEGWKFMPFMGQEKPAASTAEEVKQSQVQLDLAGPLVDYAKKGHKIELAGEEKVADKDAYKLKITTKEGAVIDCFVDKASGFISKLIFYVKINGQDTVLPSTFSDYKKNEAGYYFPYTVSNQGVPGAGDMIIKATKIEVNQPVDESIFEMP